MYIYTFTNYHCRQFILCHKNHFYTSKNTKNQNMLLVKTSNFIGIFLLCALCASWRPLRPKSDAENAEDTQSTQRIHKTSRIQLNHYYFNRFRVIRQSIISFQTLFRVQHMPFKLITEMSYCSRYRPCSCFTQRTNSRTVNFPLYVPQQINITHFSFTIFYIM